MQSALRGRVILLGTALAVTSLVISGCSRAKPDCTSFGHEFDRLQAQTAASAALIIDRGVCHSQVATERKSQCPQYYTWLTAAKTFSAYAAVEKAGCLTEDGRARARQDFVDLLKPDAFPAK